jgi:hypothetical protein
MYGYWGTAHTANFSVPTLEEVCGERLIARETVTT